MYQSIITIKVKSKPLTMQLLRGPHPLRNILLGNLFKWFICFVFSSRHFMWHCTHIQLCFLEKHVTCEIWRTCLSTSSRLKALDHQTIIAEITNIRFPLCIILISYTFRVIINFVIIISSNSINCVPFPLFSLDFMH